MSAAFISMMARNANPELGNSIGIHWSFRGNSDAKKGIQIKCNSKSHTVHNVFANRSVPEFPSYKIKKETYLEDLQERGRWGS